MRNSMELTPEQQVRVGHFSAVKANMAFDAIRRYEARLEEVSDQSRGTTKTFEGSGASTLDTQEESQIRKDIIGLTEHELAESRREFREACEEAAKYIGPGTVGEFAIIAATRDDLFASISC